MDKLAHHTVTANNQVVGLLILTGGRFHHAVMNYFAVAGHTTTAMDMMTGVIADPGETLMVGRNIDNIHPLPRL